MQLRGIDHADIRVRSLEAVEHFYDTLLPALGLSRKTESHVDEDGEWCAVDATHPRNVIEYGTPATAGRIGWFLGFIEDPAMIATKTRIALGLDSERALPAVQPLVLAAGGSAVQWSTDPGYPALFFEDPGGTRLEICARRLPTCESALPSDLSPEGSERGL